MIFSRKCLNFNHFISFIVRRYDFFRTLFLISADFLIILFSYILGIFLYTRFVFIPYSWGIIWEIIALAFIIRLILFFVFNIYNISFQHVSHLYVLKISSIIALFYFLSYFILRFIWPSYWCVPISVITAAVDIIISVMFRFIPLIYYEISNKMGEGNKNCLIYGAGQTGQSLVHVLMRQKINIRGFIDDDLRCGNKIIHGIKVIGKFSDLEKILIRSKVEVLIIAIPSLDGKRIKIIKDLCSRLNIEVRIGPPLYRNNQHIEKMVSPIQQINYEDLLRRPIKKDNFLSYNTFFRSKAIWVTGGGGSIGTELVCQLLNLDVSRVVVLDHSELNLFNLQNNIPSSQKEKLVFKLIDLKNNGLLEKLFLAHSPQVVFHAAAYKHVPMVQENMCEGVLNNLLCFKNMYDLSCRYQVQKFIFISSDKAVKPQNVMGATKRLGELYIHMMSAKTALNACSVRFGNVIGSSGSLVPVIIDQIQKNMPITVTHPNASRFFMLVSEAVRLILKASILAEKGEIFILDMKNPIKIVDMVQDIAAFYGKELGKDIPVDYIGLRPGEKLTEELFDKNKEYLVSKEEMYIAKQKDGLLSSLADNFLIDYQEVVYCAQKGSMTEMTRLMGKYTGQNINYPLSQEIKGEEFHSFRTS